MFYSCLVFGNNLKTFHDLDIPVHFLLILSYSSLFLDPIEMGFPLIHDIYMFSF